MTTSNSCFDDYPPQADFFADDPSLNGLGTQKAPTHDLSQRASPGSSLGCANIGTLSITGAQKLEKKEDLIFQFSLLAINLQNCRYCFICPEGSMSITILKASKYPPLGKLPRVHLLAKLRVFSLVTKMV